MLAVMAERGLDSCVMEVSSHALAQHRVDGVVYDVACSPTCPRTTSTSTPTWTTTSTPRPRCSRPSGPGRGWSASTTTGAAAVERARHPGLDDRHRGRRGLADPVDADDPAAFRLTGPGVDLHLRSSLPGRLQRHQHRDGRRAGAARRGCRAVGEAVLTDPHVPGRMGGLAGPGRGRRPRAVVDYAHTPEAIRAALRALRPTTPGSLVSSPAPVATATATSGTPMGAAAAEVADLVVVTDDNPRSEDPAAIRAAVLEGVVATRAAGRDLEVLEVGDRRAAIARRSTPSGRRARPPRSPSSARATRAARTSAGVVHPFDDRAELARALRRAAGEGVA